MARFAYRLLLWLALPFIGVRLLWRARRQGAYLRDLGERFGRYRVRAARPVIWLHAVSVGEARAAQPLLVALRRAHPDFDCVMTCMTPTGREAATALLPSGELTVVYLPYDYPFAMRRFLGHFRPRIGLVMETEVWPNLMHECRAAAVPVFLVNARLSERSAARYAHLRALAVPAFAAFTGVGAQTPDDAARLVAVGARQVSVTGNLKFDAVPPAALLELGRRWRRSLGGRRVFLAASTRDGEEMLILPLCARLARAGHRVVLVPRHPQRFDDVARLIEGAGLKAGRRSRTGPDQDCDVWLGDSMGEMAAYFAMADCAFVGGSLLPLGGQNLIEAAACGCPVLIGPHTWNFAEAARASIDAGAALRVGGEAELEAIAIALLADSARLETMRAAGLAFAAAHGGAAQKTLALVERDLLSGRAGC
jgi:3-deoxy-D-manno-octulosonic-acid transferase